ncbi:hypothetical protein K440DRAFT_36961 [Wilcoxina mikolae CBS 423.85]|nr:hypothetical protein K440DRAFT_36961 [Wilcoxina mikolae CBS 423.85]
MDRVPQRNNILPVTDDGSISSVIGGVVVDKEPLRSVCEDKDVRESVCGCVGGDGEGVAGGACGGGGGGRGDCGVAEEEGNGVEGGAVECAGLYEGVVEGQRQVGIEVVEDSREGVAGETWSEIPFQEAGEGSGEIYRRRRRRSKRPPMLKTTTLVLFIIFLCCVLGIVLTYSVTYASGIEHFMSGQSISVVLLFIAFGITVRFGWEPIDREARHLETFHALSLRHQPISILLHDHPRVFPIYTEVRNLLHGNFYIVLIGVLTVLIEVLIITLTGVPYSGTETWEDARACMVLSCIILFLTIVAVVVVMVRRRRMERTLPRVPYTLATMMAYLYAAKMGADFVGVSALEGKEREMRLQRVGRGRSYGFGWTVGEDGRWRVGVDREELRGGWDWRGNSGEKRGEGGFI